MTIYEYYYLLRQSLIFYDHLISTLISANRIGSPILIWHTIVGIETCNQRINLSVTIPRELQRQFAYFG